MSAKLTDAQNERLRDLARRLIADSFDGSLTRTAEALGVSHPYLSQFLNGRTGAGRKLTRALSKLTGKPLAELEPLEPAVADPVAECIGHLTLAGRALLPAADASPGHRAAYDLMATALGRLMLLRGSR